jgi:hypothetical protein
VALSGTPTEEGLRLLEALRPFGPILTVKLYRLNRSPELDVPYIPCLDHEAMLHGGIAPHAALYVQEAASGDLHEIVFIPDERRLQLDIVSTWGEHEPESHERLLTLLRERMPGYRVSVRGPSWWRGERRVANACLAQVSLRDVLLGDDQTAVKRGLERLQTIASLMEKQSRVASWGVRTVTGPLLAAAGVVSFILVGGFTGVLSDTGITWLRYSLITLLGAVFLYYGLKAVQLTEMSNRVWKRTAEYNLILSERRRIAEARKSTSSPGGASDLKERSRELGDAT